MKLKKQIPRLAAMLLLAASAGCAAKTQPPAGAARDNPFAGVAYGEAVQGSASEACPDFGSEEAMLGSMSLASENDALALYYSPATMAVALKDKATGSVMTSNPYGASADPLATGDIAKNLASQLVLTYLDADNKQNTLWSSADCVAFGQFSIQQADDGVRFNLRVGRDLGSRLIPEVLTEERFGEIDGKLEGRAQSRFESLYYLKAADELEGKERDTLLRRFPLLKKQPLYLPSGDWSDRDRNDLEKYIREAGYTAAQIEADYRAIGYAAQKQVSPTFDLSVEYHLTSAGLTVRIPADSIQYSRDDFALFSVRLLEYFGADMPAEDRGGAPAAGPDDGYLFIPDGPGALIRINGQPANRRPVIAGTVYGRDAAVPQTVNSREGEPYYLPVFGIRRNNGSALFAVVDGGAEMSAITAKLGRPSSSYYTVYPTFSLAASEQASITPKVASLGSEQLVYIYDKNEYDRDLAVRYTLLTGSEAHYDGMARVYRAYLTERGMREKAQAGSLPLGVETLGTSLYDAVTLGVATENEAVYTMYAQSREIAAYFLQNGADALNLSLNGWRDRGLDAGAANRVKLSGVLGGKKGFAGLRDWAKENGVGLYPEADMLFVQPDRLLDGFSRNSDASRMLNKKYAGERRYLSDRSAFGPIAYAVSPHKYASYWDRYFGDYGKYGLDAAGLTTAGQFLNSNFTAGRAYHRGQTLDILTQRLRKLSESYGLSFTGANAYVLPYADLVRGLTLTNSGYPGESSTVPFLQLALDGAVICESGPVNLEEDERRTLLRCIESRTAPSFVFAAQNVRRLKSTAYTYYYAVDFEVLKEDALSQYQFVREALEPTKGLRMTGHRLLSDGVACTSYENGVRVYVNYNDTPYAADGLTINAQDYLVIRQEGAGR